MAAAPRVISSAGWKMKTTPKGSRSLIRPRSMAAPRAQVM